MMLINSIAAAAEGRMRHLRGRGGSMVRRAHYMLARGMAERRLRDQRYLREFLAARPAEALAPDFADLLFLYECIRKRKPRLVLEFGSGCSTLIIAQALVDNAAGASKEGGHLFSLEADPRWADVTLNCMPTGLHGLYEIIHSPLQEVEWCGTSAFRHTNVPDVIPDFVYLDGPSLTPERQVAVDPIDLEESLSPGFFMIVDGRLTNTIFLKQHLKRRYAFKHRKLSKNSTFELLG